VKRKAVDEKVKTRNQARWNRAIRSRGKAGMVCLNLDKPQPPEFSETGRLRNEICDNCLDKRRDRAIKQAKNQRFSSISKSKNTS